MAQAAIAVCRREAESALQRGDRTTAAKRYAEALAEASSRPDDPAAAAEVAPLLAVLRQVYESGGRYAWAEIYERYVERVVPVSTATSNWQPETSLDVEPFVGPIRIGASEVRGRGLFLTQDVNAGSLLMCAEAVAAGGPNTELMRAVAARMLASAELQDAVLALSRGTSDTEVALPSFSTMQLAKPSAMREGRRPIDATWEELMQVLWFNQFALPTVDISVAPMSISSDPQRSGLWLLPAFLNHSCLPNVQKVIVGDRLFLRATRDLPAGVELFESYVGLLDPLARRREVLEKYGFACCCVRCKLEEAVLDPAEVQRVADLVEKEGSSYLDCCEAVSKAESLIDRSLYQCLSAGKLPAFPGIPFPDRPIPTRRALALREGAERVSSEAEEESLRRQNRLRSILLGSFGDLMRAQAVAARVDRQFLRSAQAWEKLLTVLAEVQPCSEAVVLIVSEVLANTVATIRGDPVKALRGRLLRKVLLASHRAYGGGAAAWLLMSGHRFESEMCEAARAEWAEILAWGAKNGLKQFCNDGYDPAELLRPRPAPVATTAVAASTPTAPRASTSLSTIPVSPATQAPSSAAQRSAVTPAAGTVASSVVQSAVTVAGNTVEASASQPPSAAPPSYELAEAASAAGLTITAALPGLSSAEQVALELAERELRLTSLVSDYPHVLTVPLPRAVDADGCTAKWSRRNRTLTVHLPAIVAVA